jgi:hypothetical protein
MASEMLEFEDEDEGNETLSVGTKRSPQEALTPNTNEKKD